MEGLNELLVVLSVSLSGGVAIEHGGGSIRALGKGRRCCCRGRGGHEIGLEGLGWMRRIQVPRPIRSHPRMHTSLCWKESASPLW